MFINKKVKCNISDVVVDPEGRYVSMLIKEDVVTIALMVIYAPNKDSPYFFERIFEQMLSKSDKIVVVGDFNVVMNPELDRKSSDSSQLSNAAQRVQEIMAENKLEDIWRVRNPEDRRYSWYRGSTVNALQCSRLDFAIISQGLSHFVHDTFYLRGVKSDHSAFFIGIETEYHDRGVGFWKFNTTYLADPVFIQEMNQTLDSIVTETVGMDPSERWECIKIDIAKKAKEYAKRKCSADRLIESQLHEKILEYESRLDSLTDEDLHILNNTKIDMDEIIDKKTRGIMFRSKAKWAVEGEKNTKYFMNLEKSNYQAKTCYALFRGNEIVRNPQEVLNMQRDFYQSLYTADENVVFSLENQVEITVPDGLAARSLENFSLEELSVAVKSMKNNSCPGSDGLPIEIYKVFWAKLRQPMHDMIRDSFDKQLLQPSLRHGIVNVIPKGNKDTRFLKNLRPITLLNSDYKVLEKMVANRMVPSTAANNP